MLDDFNICHRESYGYLLNFFFFFLKFKLKNIVETAASVKISI